MSKWATGAENTKYTTAVRVKEYIILAYIRVSNMETLQVMMCSNDVLIPNNSIRLRTACVNGFYDVWMRMLDQQASSSFNRPNWKIVSEA